MKEVILSDSANEIATARYFGEDEDWKGAIERVVDSNIQNEINLSKIKKDELRKLFFDMIYYQDFIPGGRIIRNSGRVAGSMMNCYVLKIDDSINSIGEFYKNCLILWANGGGVGTSFSSLRPKGDTILGKGGVSSGLVSFLIAADNLAKTIESGGGRRAAGMALVDVSHPEIIDFIDAKLELGILSSFNISVGITNEFLEQVEKDGDWDLTFNKKVYKTIKARFLWDKILINMIKSAEPGVLNMTNLIKNNSYYFSPVIATNPCGEQPLEDGGVCCLGSLNLPNFITGNVNTNWKKLEQKIELAVRFLDNVIDINKYSLQKNDLAAHNSRRIGLGVMGLADYLFAKKLRYGSEKALVEIERLFKFIRDCAYQASVKLAQEKGAFPKFDAIPFGKASFIRKLPAKIRMDIKQYGIRNCTLLTCAPTGTTSLLTEGQSGIEPLFSKAYKRVDRVGERSYIHPILLEYPEGDFPDWYVDAYDLKPEDHFETQVIIQKYIDSSVSKTINLPEHTKAEDLDKLLLEYVKDLKGVTVYRDKSRSPQILAPLSKEEIIEELKNNNITNSHDENAVQCASGSCDL